MAVFQEINMDTNYLIQSYYDAAVEYPRLYSTPFHYFKSLFFSSIDDSIYENGHLWRVLPSEYNRRIRYDHYYSDIIELRDRISLIKNSSWRYELVIKDMCRTIKMKHRLFNSVYPHKHKMPNDSEIWDAAVEKINNEWDAIEEVEPEELLNPNYWNKYIENKETGKEFSYINKNDKKDPRYYRIIICNSGIHRYMKSGITEHLLYHIYKSFSSALINYWEINDDPLNNLEVIGRG